MAHYEIIKRKALEFAAERKAPVYICKAKRKMHYYIIFKPEELTPNYMIIETVQPPEESEAAAEC